VSHTTMRSGYTELADRLNRFAQGALLSGRVSSRRVWSPLLLLEIKEITERIAVMYTSLDPDGRSRKREGAGPAPSISADTCRRLRIREPDRWSAVCLPYSDEGTRLDRETVTRNFSRGDTS